MTITFNLQSDLSTLTESQLADRLGKEKADAKRAAEKAKQTEAEIKARGVKEATGNVYKFVLVDGGTREGFDAKVAKTFLSLAQLQACKTEIKVAPSVRIYGA